MKAKIRNTILTMMNGLLRPRGYAVKPLGNEHKKIDIMTIDGFRELATLVINEKRTYLGADRLYTLWQAVNQASQYDADMAEIGVFRGGSAKFIASILLNNKKVNSALHLFDTFEGMPEQQSDIDKRRLGGFEDTTIDTVRSYLSGFYNVQLYEGIVQEQSSNVNDCRFSMVHIDVDIYAPYVYCLEFFSDRLVRGGIIVLDDYGFLTCPGAKRAADEFMLSRGRDFRMIHLLTGQAVIVKI